MSPERMLAGEIAFVGRGCSAATLPVEDPCLADPSGKIALIERGLCS